MIFFFVFFSFIVQDLAVRQKSWRGRQVRGCEQQIKTQKSKVAVLTSTGWTPKKKNKKKNATYGSVLCTGYSLKKKKSHFKKKLLKRIIYIINKNNDNNEKKKKTKCNF